LPPMAGWHRAPLGADVAQISLRNWAPQALAALTP